MSCKPEEGYWNPRDIGLLQGPVRDRIWTAVQMAPSGGLIPVSLARHPFQQWLLRHERCPGRECDFTCKGHPVTATPAQWNGKEWVGGSNHQRGLAADMGGRDLWWLIDHRHELGLELTVPSENWHFEARGEPTWKIIKYGKGTDPNEGRKWKGFRAHATDRSIYVAGGLDNEVTEVQLRLVAIGTRTGNDALLPGRVDGHYGDKSIGAVQTFKKETIKLQKALGQKVWPNADPNVGVKFRDMLRFMTP